MHRKYRHPFIAREGWPFITVALALALVVHGAAGGGWALPFWALFLFMLQFFRDPPRPVAQGTGAVLSPADGRIVTIEPARDPWLDRSSLKISVFIGLFNTHSNRSPVDGEVTQRWYEPGNFLNAALDKASHENERNALHIRTHDGQDLTCVQVAGVLARRILCYVEEGAKLVRGQRYGFIRFGSRIDLYLPSGSRARVTIGDKVFASSTVIAELP